MEDIRSYRIEEEKRSARNDDEVTLRLMRDVEAATREEEVPFHVPRD